MPAALSNSAPLFRRRKVRNADAPAAIQPQAVQPLRNRPSRSTAEASCGREKGYRPQLPILPTDAAKIRDGADDGLQQAAACNSDLLLENLYASGFAGALGTIVTFARPAGSVRRFVLKSSPDGGDGLTWLRSADTL